MSPLFPPQDYRKTAWTHRRGLYASKPLATDVLPGTLYFSTDRNLLERSDGTNWESYSGSSGASGGASFPYFPEDEEFLVEPIPFNPQISKKFTVGSVLFSDANGLASQDNASFFWDITNKRIGVGNITPAVEIDIIKATVGNQVGFRVRNSDNTNAASDAVFIQSVGGSSGGDAYFSMSVTGATTFACGIDNSDSDKWKIAASGTVGSSDAITITTGRIVAMPVYGAGTATFDANGVISSVSDERMKKDILSFPGGLRELLALQPITYKYIPESGLDTKNTYVGFSAQNVMKFIPSAIGRSADVFDKSGKLLSSGKYSINDRTILAAAINAIQALQSQIDELQSKMGLPLFDRTVEENVGENGIILADPQVETDTKGEQNIKRLVVEKK